MQVGVELEAFVFAPTGEPVDFYHWLLENWGSEEVTTRVGVIKTDAGKHLIEVALRPIQFDEVDVIPEMFDLAFEEVGIPQNWQLVFQGVDPRGLNWNPQEWAPKSRYKAIWRALEVEAGKRWRGVLSMSRLAATHLHVALNLNDPHVIRVINYLNMPNPLLSYASKQRIRAWQSDWARKERLPYFRRWQSLEEMVEYWSKIPLLLRTHHKWDPDLKNLPRPGDPVAEGTVWWLARPRWSLGTVEVRIADSMPPPKIPEYVKEVIRYIETLLS